MVTGGAGRTNRAVLDRSRHPELILQIFSFSGGENTKGEDHELGPQDAREIKNWEAISLGGMRRSEGFTEVADDGAGAPAYTDDYDLLHYHYEGANTAVYGIINTDLVIKSGADINQEDSAAFTAGILSHAVTAGDTAWITNSTDNLRYKTIGNAIATPTNSPSSAKDRIYFFKERLIAEGGGSNPKVVEGSRAGTGNWKSTADTWTASNDAFSATFEDETRGCVPAFPTGQEVAVFTDFACFSLLNFPNVGIRPIQNSHGCALPLSIALGNEGVYFFSDLPTRGIYLWDSVSWINLTDNLDWVDDVDISKRAYAKYRDNKYYFIYNESGSGDTFPNRLRIFDAKFGRWFQRPINSALSDNFGYPALLSRDNNELYIGSSQNANLYELDDGSTSDAGENTEASYKTKIFTSRDFNLASGGSFGIDDVRMKLLKISLTFSGQTGSLGFLWTADRGERSGSLTFDLTADGDKLNTTFIVNTSKIISTPPDKTITKTFKNNAVGNAFQFQITNNDTGNLPEVKKIKIHAMALEEM